MAKVLVIDDSPVAVQLVTHALEAAGIEADSAASLAVLDARLSVTRYDLVLVDVNMPEMYGDDVVEFLRTQKGVTALLYLYSGLSEGELEARVKSSGADGYFLKSEGVQATVDGVRELLGVQPRAQRVLVVDDSAGTARLLEAELKALGYQVNTAGSAEEATRIILKKKTRPALVLLDVQMPNVNGEEFCRFIKGNSLFAGIRVVLVSSVPEDELKRIAAEAGADGYLRKDRLIAREILDLLEGSPPGA